jgi:hypothetical protein
MLCPRCGTTNDSPTRFCSSCGTPLAPKPRTSGLAIASLILGIVALPTCGLGGILGLIFGIVSLISIGRNRGRLTGQGLAIAGICVSGLMLVLLLPAIIFPVFFRAGSSARKAGCQAHLKQLSLAIMLYCEDSGGRLPPSATWSDAASRSSLNRDPKQYVCPSAPRVPFGYAYNSSLSSLTLDSLVRPENVPLLFDSDLGWNGAGQLLALPAAPRHSGPGNEDVDNFAFVDGHVKAGTRSFASGLEWQPVVSTERTFPGR